jgi:hypothetical protein
MTEAGDDTWNSLPDASDPDRPDVAAALEDGDLYVYAEADLEDIAAEVFAQVRELEGVDDTQATEIATMIYDLHTGDWLHTDE